MTKSEMSYTDSSMCGPLLLFMNQYFNTFIEEYYVLWICLVSYINFTPLRYFRIVCCDVNFSYSCNM